MIDLLKVIKSRVFVIAEVGCNHNGDMNIARKLVDVSSDCGADAVKFQSFIPQNMITQDAPKAEYQIRATGLSESQYKRLCRLRLTQEDHIMLTDYCRDKKIPFISTAFDEESVDILAKLDVPFFKIGSGEITNLPLLKRIGSLDKPVLLSTGMSNLGEIEEALSFIGRENRGKVVLMHCVSDYPAKWEDANLRAIQTLREAFHLPVGFSDHTEGIELSLVAVGMGAVVIEKHITLDKNMEGGDHKASLQPHEFKSLVLKIRRLEAALGDGIKRCMPSEENVRMVARKSIVARENIKKGDRIKKDMLTVKRPGTGIPPKYLKMVINCIAKQDICKDRLIHWSNLDFNTD